MPKPRAACSMTFCLVALSLIAPAAFAIDYEAESKRVLEADRQFQKATVEQGLEGWMAAFDDDAVMFGREGTSRGKAQIREAMAAAFATPGFRFTWTPIRAEVSNDGQLGYSYGQYDRRVKNPEGQDNVKAGTYVTVWKKQKDGSWKVLADFGTSAPVVAKLRPSS